ncbi:AMP-binding protein [Amycolatopsis thermoflava]|uniref:AMP-binding protein n=1 Tax=Amycolatopsis thermoflava TaxID=84480 RepID=UPI00040EBB52|nr:AMP-binding protein [Amycolatopsis thermoflava]
MKPIPSWGTVPRMLRATAEERPDTVVCLDGDVRLTQRDLRAFAARVARSLIALGVGPGDRVAVWAPNTWEWVVTAFGIWDAGAIIVPLSTRGKGIETAELLRRTGCSVLVTTEGFLGRSSVDMLAEVAGPARGELPFADLPELRHVVVLGTPRTGPGLLPWPEFLAAGEAITRAHAEDRALAVEPGDPFEILCTSGTTGAPKGVVLDGSQIMRAYWDWAEVIRLGAGDRYPIVSPFAHGFGINAGLLVCVQRGATMVPVPVFNPDAAFDLIEDNRLSVLAGPPSLFARMLGRPDLPRRDLSSLRVAVVGAATVPTELVRAMQTTMGFEQVVNAYGLIEGSCVTMTRAEDPPKTIAATAGRPMPGVQVRIAGDDEQPLPAGERGEILVRGYGVMHGYWNAPDLTAAAINDDGWLRTGDIGVLDEAGNLSIVDRKKEMFICNGFNAYPAEIENLLLHNDALDQVAVVAVDDATQGEVAWAYAVPAPGADPDEEAVITWARNTMSNYKVPRRVVFVPQLPTTPNGKIDKAKLREAARANLTRAT